MDGASTIDRDGNMDEASTIESSLLEVPAAVTE